MSRFCPYSSTKGFWQFSAALAAVSLAGCASSSTRPAVEVHTVEVVKEIQRPCPVKKPDRPGPLTRPLPTDSIQLNALLALKLADYAAPGGYTDKLEALLAICTKETTP